jgi:hypothetical protein
VKVGVQVKVPSAAGDVLVDEDGVAQRAGGELAVVEDFGVAEADRLPGAPDAVDLDLADEVLSEVDQGRAAGGEGQVPGG